MIRYFGFALILLTSNIWASEYPSKETKAEIARDSSVDALMLNEAIKSIDRGDIITARKQLCSSMDVNLIILHALQKLHPDIEKAMITKALTKIAKDHVACEFSEDSKLLLKSFKKQRQK
jgi:hypothetical protein